MSSRRSSVTGPLSPLARRNVRRIKDVADAAKNVAAVIEGDRPEGIGQRKTCLQINDRKSISAERYSKGIKENRITVASPELAGRNDNDTRPGRFEIKPAKRTRTARKKAFADRKDTFQIGDI